LDTGITINLNWRERIFLRACCFTPPDAPEEPRDKIETGHIPEVDPDPMALLRRVFPGRFERSLQQRILVDIGCGMGAQVLGAAENGAKLAIGVDRNRLYLKVANEHAIRLGLTDRVRFTDAPLGTLGSAWADVVISQNSFEHFDEPDVILREAYNALKPGGEFFVTFGPPWWNPYGAHHFFMIKCPWSHVVFSERTILNVRQLFRPNSPARWGDVALNRMTISKFLSLIHRTDFKLTYLSLIPIRPLPKWISSLKWMREWTTSTVSAIMTKDS